jgi:hypothetical protein
MSDVEQALSVLLEERAERVGARPGHREATLRRARRRRAVNAGAAAVVVVAAGLGVVRTVDRGPQDRPAAPAAHGPTTATAGDYGFWSKAGPEYPWVARGYFRERRWELRAAAIRMGDPLTRVTLVVERRGYHAGASASTGFESLDGGLFVQHYGLTSVFDREVAVVFGAATPATQAVDVVMDEDGAAIEAHVYEGYDARTGIEADYWVAFVPADTGGRVIARNAEGAEVASAPFTPMR